MCRCRVVIDIALIEANSAEGRTTASENKCAAERLAISRARQTEVDVVDRESLDVRPSVKNAPTEGVGCMALLGCLARIYTCLPDKGVPQRIRARMCCSTN